MRSIQQTSSWQTWSTEPDEMLSVSCYIIYILPLGSSVRRSPLKPEGRPLHVPIFLSVAKDTSDLPPPPQSPGPQNKRIAFKTLSTKPSTGCSFRIDSLRMEIMVPLLSQLPSAPVVAFSGGTHMLFDNFWYYLTARIPEGIHLMSYQQVSS